MKIRNPKCNKGCTRTEAAQDLPGAAADIADRERPTEREIRQDTAKLGNNPRMHDDE